MKFSAKRLRKYCRTMTAKVEACIIRSQPGQGVEKRAEHEQRPQGRTETGAS